MSERSEISWTDSTFNPWIGCTKVSPGCANCYAETLMDTRYGRVKWGKGNPRERTSEANWKNPLQWNRQSFSECQSCGWRGPDAKISSCPNPSCQATELPFPARQRVFCASLSDWLDDEVPIEWLVDLLNLIFQTRHLDWLLLTKRPQNWGKRLHEALRAAKDPGLVFEGWLSQWLDGDYPGNVWIGTTTEDQTRADERIPELLKIPARVRFLSCEPLLGPIDLSYTCFNGSDSFGSMPGIHWVITGGESGQGARPMNPEWVRSIRDQCAAAGVSHHFKQWGEFAPRHDMQARDLPGKEWVTFDPDTSVCRVGKKAAGRLLDGKEHNEFPA
jgi:protein gp37